MGLTTNQLPYPEPTDSVDVVRDVKALAEAVDAKVLAVHQSWGGKATGVTDLNGIVNLAHGAPWTPTWVVATMDIGTTGTSLGIITSVHVQYVDATTIALRFRREDTNQWLQSNPVTAFVSFGR
jgi:hypothetical protein